MGGIFVYIYLTYLLFLSIFAVNKRIMEEIIQKICEEFNISRDDFFNIKYVRFYVAIRSVTMIILKEKGFKTKSQADRFIREYRKDITKRFVEENYGLVVNTDDLSDAIAIAHFANKILKEENEKS